MARADRRQAAQQAQQGTSVSYTTEVETEEGVRTLEDGEVLRLDGSMPGKEDARPPGPASKATTASLLVPPDEEVVDQPPQGQAVQAPMVVSNPLEPEAAMNELRPLNDLLEPHRRVGQETMLDTLKRILSGGVDAAGNDPFLQAYCTYLKRERAVDNSDRVALTDLQQSLELYLTRVKSMLNKIDAQIALTAPAIKIIHPVTVSVPHAGTVQLAPGQIIAQAAVGRVARPGQHVTFYQSGAYQIILNQLRSFPGTYAAHHLG